MNDMDMLFDAAEFEKTTASTFARLAADTGSECRVVLFRN